MKRKTLLLLSLAVVVGLTGCSGSDKAMEGASANEITTIVPVDQEKTMITVRVEFGAGQQDNFEQVLEEKFPNVDIVLQHDGSTSSVYTMRENLENGVECDLILSRRLPVTEDIADQYLLDLSAEDFVNNYYISAVDSCANPDGKIYYLPGPSDVYGIVYDKTMFEENGWELPHSYSEFIALLQTIRESNPDIVPLQASIMYPDMFQILFNTFGFEDAYAGSENYIWLSEYQQGKGSMVGHMEAAVADFQRLFDDGMLSVSDLDVTPTERSQMLYVDHSAAMTIECQNAVTYNQTVTQDADGDVDVHEMAMMPFWTSDEEDSDYLYVIPSYYMAINKSSAEESDEKKQLLLDIYSYLSSEEGQEMLIGDNFQVSNISDMRLTSNSFSEGIIDTINRGQTINTLYLAAGETNKQVERQMLGSLKDMLNGDMSVEDWLLAADEVRDQYVSGELTKEESYGQSETTLTRLETAYTVAQMYADETDAQIGICRGGGWGKSTNGYFYEGDITDSLLECLTPDKEPQTDSEDPYEGKIVVSSLTGQQILDILNSTEELSGTKGFATYFVAYGLDVKFAPWADEGSKVQSCKTADGKELDPDAVYEVAYFYGSLPDETLEPESALDGTWQDNFLTWLNEQGGVIKQPEMTLKLVYDK